MKNWRQLLGNERGTALALALIIMVIMTVLAVGLATMGGVESRISAGQSAGTRARLLAESGIEYAFLSLAGVPFTATLLAGAVLVPAGTTLPGLTAASGTFGVTIRNDIKVGDALLTGAAPIDAHRHGDLGHKWDPRPHVDGDRRRGHACRRRGGPARRVATQCGDDIAR